MICFGGFFFLQGDDKKNAATLCESIIGSSNPDGSWQLGLTKIFLKDSHDQMLEDAREDVFTKQAVVLQKFLRGAFARRRFTQQKSNMIVIQRRWRAFVAKQQYVVMATGFGRLQATILARRLSTNFKTTRTAMLGLQTYARGFLARQRFSNLVNAIERIQAILRMVLATQKVAG